MRTTISHNRKLQAWVAVGLVTMIVGLAVGFRAIYHSGRDTRAFDQRICEHVNRLDDALLSVLERSLRTLPSNPYYRQHPAELRIALANTRYAIRQIDIAHCSVSENQ